MALEFRLPFRYKPGKVARLEAEISKLKRTIGGVNIPNGLFPALDEYYGVSGSTNVTESTATTLSAVWHAITIHCNSLNIPIQVFKRQPDGDSFPVGPEDAYEFQVDYLLGTSPNLIMTPSMWIQMMETSRLIYGNGYSFINRDMVGVPNGHFAREGFSEQYAPDILNKVWDAAHRAGYAGYFSEQQGGTVNDDHLYINKYIKIPTIDIIHHDPNTHSGFFEFWHTTKDNMDHIDRATLKAVGQTLLTVIFEEGLPA